MTIRSSSDTTYSGFERTFSTVSEFDFLFHVTEVLDDGNTAVTVTAQKSRFPATFRQLSAAFQGYSFDMKLSPRGRVVEFVNTDGLRESVRKRLIHATGRRGRRPMPEAASDRLVGAISDDALRAMIEPVLAIWPEIPVAPGDTWTRDDQYDPASDTLDSTTFTLESIDPRMATVKFESQYRAAKRKSDVDMAISGTGSGTALIVPDSGEIRSYQMTIKHGGTATNPTVGSAIDTESLIEVQARLWAR